MLESKIVIPAESGLHARPAGELVKLVKSFAGSKVTLSTTSKTVNAASMLSVLSLGLKKGSELTVSVDGGDEAMVMGALTDFLANID